MNRNMHKIKYFPIRTASFLFILYSNSDYSTFGNNAAFSCEDESIRQPFVGDTISVKHLLIVQIVAMAIIVYITELLYKNSHDTLVKNRYKLYLKYYYSGLLFVLTFCEILKNCFTKLRPHFFSTCIPDMTNINCSQGLITNFNCTGTESPDWLIKRDVYKSFPSGHAAISVYACIFVCLYLSKKGATQTSLNVWWSRLIFMLSILWAITCCISRVLDNRHFWWDVFIGASIGLVSGISTIFLAFNQATNKAKRSL